MQNKKILKFSFVGQMLVVILCLSIPCHSFAQIWYFIPENTEYRPNILVRDTNGNYWVAGVPPIYLSGINCHETLRVKLSQDPNYFVNIFNNADDKWIQLDSSVYSWSKFKLINISNTTSSEIVGYIDNTPYKISTDFKNLTIGTKKLDITHTL